MKQPILVISLLLISMCLAAEELPLRIAGSINQNNLCASSGDGNYILVWSDTSSGSEDVYGQKFNMQGVALWETDIAIASSSSMEYPTQVLKSSDDHNIIIWYQDLSASTMCIMAQKLDSNGQKLWGLDGIAITGPMPMWIRSQALPNQLGGCMVVFQSGQAGHEVYRQNLDASGNLLWGAGGTLIDSFGVRSDIKDLIPDGTGGYILNLHQQDFSTFNARLLHLSAEGVILGNNPMLAQSPLPYPDYRIKAMPDGNFALFATSDFSPFSFYMQKLDIEGNLLLANAFQYNMGNYWSGFEPQVNFYPDGRLLLSWEARSSSAAILDFRIVGFNINYNVAWQAGGITAPLNSGDECWHNVALAPNGTCYVVCNTQVAIYQPNGQAVLPGGSTTLSGSSAFQPAINAENSQALILWRDVSLGKFSLRKQVLTATGAVLLPQGGVAHRELAAYHAGYPELFALENRFVALWGDCRFQYPYYKIFYQIIADGQPLLEPAGRALYPYSILPENFVQAIPLRSELAIVYSMYVQDVPTAFLQIIDANGNSVYPERGIAIYSDPLPGSINTLRASFYQGDFYFVWRKYVTGENSHYEIRAQRISGGISRWGTTGRVIRNLGGQRYVNVQAVQGNYFIWTEDNVIRVLRLDADGNPLTPWNSEGNYALDPVSAPYCNLEGSFLRGNDLGLIIESQEQGQNYIKGQLLNEQGQRLCDASGVSLLPAYPSAEVVGFIYDGILSLAFHNGNEIRLLRMGNDFVALAAPLGTVIYSDNPSPTSLALVRYQDGSYSCFLILPVADSSTDSNVYVQQLDGNGVQADGLITICSAPLAQSDVQAASWGANSYAIWQDKRASLLESSEIKISIFGIGHQSSFSAISDAQQAPASVLSFSKPYPNPFFGNTNLELNCKEPLKDLQVNIYDLKGQKVKRLFHEQLSAGIWKFAWDGRDDTGRQCGSGIYFISARSGKHASSQKLLYLKE